VPLGGDETQHRFSDDAECSFATDEELGQRQSGDVLEPGPTELGCRAIGQHDREAENVVGRNAVFDTAQSARVGRDIAPNGAELERRGIGRYQSPCSAPRP